MGSRPERFELNALTATMLEASASGYAAAACAASRDRATASSAPGATMFADQRAWFVQRILELAAAVKIDAPDLFTRRVLWLRSALLARGVADDDLRSALSSLRDALTEELPRHLSDCATGPIERAIAESNGNVELERSALDPADAAGRLALVYLEACLAAEPERAIDTVLDGLGTFSPQQLLTRVLAPAEREIGRLWHSGDASVVEQRLVSETTRQLLAIIAHRCAPNTHLDRTALAASVSGNIHDLGLRIVADLFRLAGWRSIFLGATVPSDQLARAVPMFSAHLVILNATLVTHLTEAAAAIEAIRRSSDTVKILVGGAAFDDARDSWRSIGADGYAATLEDAVERGTALIGPTGR